MLVFITTTTSQVSTRSASHAPYTSLWLFLLTSTPLFLPQPSRTPQHTSVRQELLRVRREVGMCHCFVLTLLVMCSNLPQPTCSHSFIQTLPSLTEVQHRLVAAAFKLGPGTWAGQSVPSGVLPGRPFIHKNGNTL